MPAPVVGMFYQAVVAAVLLYGSESSVLPDAKLARLESFHVECARRLTGMRPRKRGGGMGLSQVRRRFACLEAPTLPLLHTKAEG